MSQQRVLSMPLPALTLSQHSPARSAIGATRLAANRYGPTAGAQITGQRKQTGMSGCVLSVPRDVGGSAFDKHCVKNDNV